MDFTAEDGRILLEYARGVIAWQLGRGKTPEDGSRYPGFQQKGATFVTLKKRGQLRGCIGNLEPVGTIWDGIRENALNAAFHDYRFSPLKPEELDDIHVDISLLTPAIPLEYADSQDLLKKLQPGRDGVILRHGMAQATFLPQVWEQLPRTEEFLGHLCRKAGLHETCWQDMHPEIRVYQVQCFAEETA